MHECPSRNDLESLLNGGASNIDWDGLNSHLENCGTCESVLDELTEMSDVGIQLLSSLPPTDEDEPAFRDLHARLLASPTVFCGDETMDGVTGDFFHDEPFANEDLPIDVGRYRLLEPIGAGASGTVYKARHLDLDRPVAIKILSQRRSMDRDSVERFRKEIRAIGQLQHPNIVHATDAGQVDGRHYLVMEYADGINLSELIQNHGPLSIANACKVIQQAALGLAYAHEQKMVHRDVKLSNLLLTADGTVKLLDLGLVAVQSNPVASHDSTTSGKPTDAGRPNEAGRQNEAQTDSDRKAEGPRGTADYMSPEQWTHYDSVDHRSDLYSLGCTLFKLLTGTAPFFKMPAGCHSKRDAHLSHAAPDLTEVRSDIPSHLQDTVQRLLAKDPDERIQTATEVARRMSKHSGGANLAGMVGPSSSDPNRRPPIYQRRKFLYAASAAVLLGGLANWQSRAARARRLATSVWRPLTPARPRFLRYAPTEAATPRPQPKEPTTTDTNTNAAAKPTHETPAVEMLPEFISFYEATDKRVAIETEQPVLLNFGRPTRGVFSLSTTIEQSPWQGSTGLFFGYQLSASETSFHTIQLLRSAGNGSADSSEDSGKIIWQRHRFGRLDGENFVIDDILAEAILPTSPNGRVQLQVTLGLAGMPEVLYQEQRLSDADWELSFEGREQHGLAPNMRKSAYLGRLGVVCGTSPTTIENTRLKYHA